MTTSNTRDHQEANMPAKARRNTKATGDQGGERPVIEAKGIRLQKLDGDAQPVGEPVTLDGVATVELRPDDSYDVADLLAAHDVNQSQAGGTIEFETDDPAAVELARELLRIPVPTAVIASWWPAMVRLPSDPHVWSLCKVFLTPQGLYVYRHPPAEPETFTAGATPAWYSSVNFEETRRPVVGNVARNAGIPIMTAAGQVIVQPTTGCGCANRPLKNWRPSWSRNVISWDDGVRLVLDATKGR